MKKKILSIVLIVALILSISACSKTEPESAVEPKSDQPKGHFQPDFDSVKSAKMGAFMLNGFFLLTDEYYFAGFMDRLLRYKTHKVDADGTITVLPRDDNNITEFPELGNTSFLCEGPDNTIYFINAEKAIVRLPVDGNDYEIISDTGVSYLSIANDKLYYTRGDDFRFYSANLDGSGEELIIDKETFYTYVIDEYVIYQDDADNESIHLYDMDTKEDVKLLDGPSYNPNIVGNYLYCSLKDPEVGFSKLIGGEFNKDTGFEQFAEDVLNHDNSGWFTEASDLSYIMHDNAGLLYFTGKSVRNFGEPDQSFMDLDGEVEMWATIPSYHFYEDSLNFGSNGIVPLYSSPYGRIFREFGSDVATVDYFSKYTNFENALYEPDSNVDNVTKELKEKAEAK